MKKSVILKTLLVVVALCCSFAFAQGSNALVGKWGMEGQVLFEFTATKMISVGAKQIAQATGQPVPPDVDYKIVGDKIQTTVGGKTGTPFSFKVAGKKLTLTPTDDPDPDLVMTLDKL